MFRDQRDELAAQGTLANVFGGLNPAAAPGLLKDDVLLGAARDQLAGQYDAREGASDRAEIPDADDLERLLRHWRSPDATHRRTAKLSRWR
jgi:hypothetical protein